LVLDKRALCVRIVVMSEHYTPGGKIGEMEGVFKNGKLF